MRVVWLAIAWLVVAGPVSGVALAWTTGPLTWTRALSWTTGCQVVAVLTYLWFQSLPIRSFSGMPTPWNVLMSHIQFGLIAIAVGLVFSLFLTALGRVILRG